MADKSRRSTFRDHVKELKAQNVEPPRPYSVSMTASAKEAYLELRKFAKDAEARGDSSNQHCTTYRAVHDAVHRLIPANPSHRKYALHAPLTGMFRIAKGRLRIAWAVDEKHRAILIMYLSNDLRKDGDIGDPYVVLNAMAKAGYLKSIVEDWQRALETPPDAPIN